MDMPLLQKVQDTLGVYFFLVSFILGTLGILILSYRADSYKHESGKKYKISTFKESSVSTLVVVKEMYRSSKFELALVCTMLSLVGMIILAISVLPRIFIKRWLS